MAALYAIDLLDRARRLTDDRKAPYEVDDALMYSFITDAERELAITGRLLRRVVQFDIVADQNVVEYEDGIQVLEFRSAELVDANKRHPLRILGTMDSVPLDEGVHPYGVASSSNSTPGRPTTLVLGKRSSAFEILPKSDGPYTLETTLILYPNNAIEDPDDILSIPERYHTSVPIGAAVRALDYSGYQETNAKKLEDLTKAWKRVLVRAAAETGAISRDAGNIKFSNDLWS